MNIAKPLPAYIYTLAIQLIIGLKPLIITSFYEKSIKSHL